MTENYFQLGATFIIALGLLEIIKVLIGFLYKKNNNRNGLISAFNEISGNHLNHIYDEIKLQTQQHQQMIILLTEINTKIGK